MDKWSNMCTTVPFKDYGANEDSQALYYCFSDREVPAIRHLSLILWKNFLRCGSPVTVWIQNILS